MITSWCIHRLYFDQAFLSTAALLIVIYSGIKGTYLKSSKGYSSNGVASKFTFKFEVSTPSRIRLEKSISLIESPTPSTIQSLPMYDSGVTFPANLIFIPLDSVTPLTEVYDFFPKISASISNSVFSSIDLTTN